MFVVEIMLVGTATRQTSYSYFSTVSYERGTIVEAPLRSGAETGIVVSVTPASAVKTALRAATFSLRKLPIHENPPRLSETFLAVAEQMSEFMGVQIGVVVSELLPADTRLLPLYVMQGETEKSEMPTDASHKSILSDTARGRTVTLKSLVREMFANKKSVLIVAPTRADCERLYKDLKGGIIDRTVILGSSLGKTKRDDALKVITHVESPALIISTPAYAHIERADIGLVVLECTRGAGYRGRSRPHLDYSESLTVYATQRGSRLVYADLYPKTERIYDAEHSHTAVDVEHLHRLMLPGTLRIVEQKKDNDAKEPFKLFAHETLETIRYTLENNGRVFIYSSRKGLASLIGCLDCGAIIRDPETGTPLALHISNTDGVEKRWFYSPQSGYKRPASDLCPECGSWRLRERGIGVQAVLRDLAMQFPKKTPLLFDHTTATSHKKARAIEDAFYEDGGTILVGTSSALPYLREQVDLSVVVSTDSLLAVPSWRQAEDAFGLLLTLREKTAHTVIAQVRHASTNTVLEHAASGDTVGFYTAELAQRKEYSYPPFSVFVLLTYRGAKDALLKIEKGLGELFSAYTPTFYGMPLEQDGLYVRRALMRFSRSEWPQKDVSERLRSLPPHIKLEINPDRII